MGDKMYFQDFTLGNEDVKDLRITRMLFCSLIIWGMGMCMLPSVFGLQNRLKSKRLQPLGNRCILPVICKILCRGEGRNWAHSSAGQRGRKKLAHFQIFSVFLYKPIYFIFFLLSFPEATPFPVCFLLKCCEELFYLAPWWRCPLQLNTLLFVFLTSAFYQMAYKRMRGRRMMWSSFAVSYGYSLKKKNPNHENKPETQKILHGSWVNSASNSGSYYQYGVIFMRTKMYFRSGARWMRCFAYIIDVCTKHWGETLSSFPLFPRRDQK